MAASGGARVVCDTLDKFSRDEEKQFAVRKHGDVGSVATLFDIVNGFLKSMP